MVGLDLPWGSLGFLTVGGGFAHLKKTFMKDEALYETWMWTIRFEQHQQLCGVFGLGSVG